MKAIATYRIPFPSKSDASKTYYLVANAATHQAISCDCNGWTRRVAPDGTRTCTHCKEQNAKAASLVGTPPPDPFAPPAPPPPPTPGRRVHPQLASAMAAGTGIARYVGDPAWVLEEKFDGHRVMVRVGADSFDAWSRPRAGGDGPLTRQLPAHIVTALKRLPPCLVDGELRIPGGHAWDVTRTDRTEELQLVLFDILECLGESIAHLADSQRRSYLEVAVAHLGAEASSLLAEPAPVTVAVRSAVTQEAVAAIWLRGGEGAILKRLTASYRPGCRTDAWVKVKKSATVTMTVTGFQDGKRGPFSVMDLTGTIAGEEVRTSVTTGAGNLDVIRDVEAHPERWVGRRIVVSYAETITDTISRRPGMTRIQLRHPCYDHVAAEHER
jgi:ATP dependent DNA ligase domain